MVWFKVDDKLHDNRKARTAKKSAMGVWVLAGSWCADNLMDGFVPASVLPRWGTPKDAESLVVSELWKPGERQGEQGWWFHDWDEYQPTKAKVEDDRAKRAAAGAKGGRRSGESRREANAQASASGLLEAQSNPRPDPSRPVLVVAKSSQSSSASRELDDDGLTRLQQVLNNCPKTHARKTAAFILAKAPADVRNPVAYIIAAIQQEPDAYRYRRGNPKRAEECELHVGEWADACRGCAIDARVEGG